MKKTFNLTHEKIKYPRMIERSKSEIRKYIKRERRKELPEGADFWDFDCKFGPAEAAAKEVHLAEIDACISDIEKQELNSFYVEIIAKPATRTRKPKPGDEPPPVVLPKIKSFGES